jgi:hypothetical protein
MIGEPAFRQDDRAAELIWLPTPERTGSGTTFAYRLAAAATPELRRARRGRRADGAELVQAGAAVVMLKRRRIAQP